MSIDVHWFVSIIGGSSFRESWPYGPGATFHPDLAIDVDADVRSSQPVVAPVTGNLLILPDAALKTCSVFLMPAPDVTKGLVNDGIGELAFFIRTLDLLDLLQRFKASVTAKLPSKVTAEQQVQNLTEGKLSVEVSSGDAIALLAPVSATNGHGLAQLEVLFAPRRGAFVGQARAIAYAKRLVDPQYQYRRLDPMAFYFKVRRGVAFEARIAAVHANHPFWDAPLTKRGLVEVREERDRALSIDAQLDIDGGAPAPST